jgi:hypothetical protein
MTTSTGGIVAICVVAVIVLLALVLVVRRAADHPGQQHPKRDPLKGLVQGGQHVGGGRSVAPTRDAPVPFGGGDPPTAEEEDVLSAEARAKAHAEHDARVNGENGSAPTAEQPGRRGSPMEL